MSYEILRTKVPMTSEEFKYLGQRIELEYLGRRIDEDPGIIFDPKTFESIIDIGEDIKDYGIEDPSIIFDLELFESIMDIGKDIEDYEKACNASDFALKLIAYGSPLCALAYSYLNLFPPNIKLGAVELTTLILWGTPIAAILTLMSYALWESDEDWSMKNIRNGINKLLEDDLTVRENYNKAVGIVEGIYSMTSP